MVVVDCETNKNLAKKTEEHSNQSLELVALVGAPNSGKTTLYNWITRSQFKTVNYPGATVETFLGTSDLSRCGTPPFMVMDTPGIYSLTPQSRDEEVTLRCLFQTESLVCVRNSVHGHVHKAILVLDGTHLGRHLLIAEQLSQTHLPFIMVITMTDLLNRHGVHIDVEKISQAFGGVPVLLFDGKRGTGLQQVAQALRDLPTWHQTHEGTKMSPPPPWTEAEREGAQSKIRHLLEELKIQKCLDVYSSTRQWDQILLHPLWGLLCFNLIMAGLFGSVFWLARFPMGLIDVGFRSLGSYVEGLAPAGTLWASFLSGGVLASFNAALVFVPQIFTLFVGIGLLEGSGYLPRAATLVDSPFSWIGLTGRSFVPLLSGYACAVPAIIATRNLSSHRDRLITSLVIPLMTCSARLPAYSLLLSFLFLNQPAWKPGVILGGIYFISMLLGAGAAAILHRVLKKEKSESLFMMELPLYRVPQFSVLFHQSLVRTWDYVARVGPLIFLFASLVWVGTTFPNYQSPSPEVRMQTSYLTRLGRKMEPLMSPMGVDWRVGVSLLSAFAARELFVPSLALMFNAGRETGDQDRDKGKNADRNRSGKEKDPDENREPRENGLQEGVLQEGTLLQIMTEARNTSGEKIFTLASVLALMVYFMIAFQCTSTFSIFVQEMKSWTWGWAQLFGFNVMGYILAVVTYFLFSYS